MARIIKSSTLTGGKGWHLVDGANQAMFIWEPDAPTVIEVRRLIRSGEDPFVQSLGRKLGDIWQVEEPMLADRQQVGESESSYFNRLGIQVKEYIKDTLGVEIKD